MSTDILWKHKKKPPLRRQGFRGGGGPVACVLLGQKERESAEFGEEDGNVLFKCVADDFVGQ